MLGKKLNNRRVYPLANRQPKHEAAERIGRAQARQELYNELSIEEKIQRLDIKFGIGVGATKQRSRLQSLLNKKNQPKPATPAPEKSEPQAVADTSTKQKSYMKGAK